MKKFLALIIALVMALSLVACGEQKQPDKPDVPDDGEQQQTASIKVGFITLHDENSTYDLNFINAAKKAIADLGLTEDNYILKTNVPEGQECYETAMDMVDKGCNIIFADSFGHEPYMIDAAKENPDVQFCHSTGTRAHTEGLANYHNAFASIYEGRYLAGIAAGMKLNEMIEAGKFTAEEAKIGYVGAFTYAEVVSGYTSFFLGARSVCPTVTMEVTFTGSWYDETLEKTGAELLIDRGCKLISQHADSYGAPTACQNAGVPNVSYNGSTKNVGKDTYIISSRIDWAPYYEYAIKAVMDGTEIATDWTGTLATGSVVLEELNTDVAAAGTAEAIAAATTKLENGELHVFDVSTFTTRADDTMNTFKVDFLKVDADGHITSYLADVDTDEAYTGDTEVVHDGYFSESEKRSAPYFDLQIDGIELLNTAM
jgi:basic membrane protein A